MQHSPTSAFDAAQAFEASARAVPARALFSGSRDAAMSRARKGAANLERTAKPVVAVGKRNDRHKRLLRARWLRSQAGNLLLSANTEKASRAGRRILDCGHVSYLPAVELIRDRQSGNAAFRGLVTCGNVWACPVCSPRIAAKRRDEISVAMEHANKAGWAAVMLTTTMRHHSGMTLAECRDAFKGAKRRLRQRSKWRRMPFVGSIGCTEVTYGKAGWHFHAHEILFLPCAPKAALRHVRALRSEWLAALATFGQSGKRSAFKAEPVTENAEYLAKFGAAEELTQGSLKEGRKADSRTPWQILEDAALGDGRSKAIWLEYAQAMRGVRAIVWSPSHKASGRKGLRELVGLNDVSDVEAASEAPEAPEVLARWDARDWRFVRERRQGYIEAAENGSDLASVEAGPTDFERWRAMIVEAMRYGERNPHRSGAVLEPMQ